MTKEKSAFQNTELGFLPQNWIIKKIAEIFDVKQGKQLSSKEKTERKSKKPFLRTSNVLWGKIDISKIDYMYFTYEEFNSLRLQKGDILLCEGGDIGRTAIWNDELNECAYQNHLHRLRTKPFKDYDNYFFYYWMQFAINKKKLYIYQGNVTTIPNLSSSRLKNFKIPSPSIHEQKKIAAVLKAVQEAKEKTEEVIKAAKELKKSLMKHLFTYGPVSIEEAEKVKLKETKAGFIPEEWDFVSLEDVCSLRKETIDPKKANNLNYIGLEHIVPDELKIRNWGNSSNVKSTKNVFYKEDILYGKLRPYLNKVAVPEKNGICSTDIMVFEVKSRKINIYYLANYLHSQPFLKYATMTMTGVNHPRTSWAKLRNYHIPLPSQKTQQEIAEAFSSIDKKIGAEENKKKALEVLFETLLNNLMTGKIRVHNLDIEV